MKADKKTILSRVEAHLKALGDKVIATNDEDDLGSAPVPYVDLVIKLLQIIKDRDAIRDALKSSATKRPAGTSRLACLPQFKRRGTSGKTTSGKTNDGGAKKIGSGLFGTVFLLGDTGRVAKLINLLRMSELMGRDMKETHDAWRREVELATLAGRHGIGPAIHDSYVCLQTSQPIGVIVMDHVAGGITLEEWRGQGPSAKQADAANMILRKKLDKLHDLGIFHLDLHTENVFVVTKPIANTNSGATKSEATKKLTSSPLTISALTRSALTKSALTRSLPPNPKVADVADIFILDYGLAKDNADLRQFDMRYLEEDVDEIYNQSVVAKHIADALVKEGALPPLW